MSEWRSRSRRYVPGFIQPCQPMPTPRPPRGADWLHEIKHDGCRMIARRDGARVRLFTRNGNDWTERFPLVVEAIGALKVKSCIIDGEITVCRPDGVASFDLLRSGRKIKPEALLHVFDLIQLDGDDLLESQLRFARLRSQASCAR